MRSILIDDIPQEGLELKEADNPRSFGLEDDKFVSYPGEVNVSLTVEKIGDSVKVKGEVIFEVRLICARCLEPFSQKISSLLDIVYEPESLRIIKQEGSLSREEGDTSYYGENGIIELGDAIREFVLLSLPVKAVCVPDCSGLCPSCGKNLNQGSCSCRREKLDPRFEKLKLLKRRK